MRWDALFQDIEGRLDEQDRAELAAEVADRSRRELARLRLSDRFRAAAATRVSMTVEGAGTVVGALARAGPDWVLVTSDAPAAGVLVAIDAITAVTGLPLAATEPDSVAAVDERWTLPYLLRGLARDRAPVSIALRDGGVVTGTVDRVGADYLDVAEHPAGEARRAESVVRSRTVRRGALACVRML